MSEKIVTRFAPSPTGFLHVGGARTALFNYLFARKHGGLFRLRIEDTDRQRSSEEMTRRIFDGLHWLGLEWDGEVVFQGANAPLHREAAWQLVEAGKAYRCFCSREELEAKRRQAEREKRAYGYDGTCRHLSPEQVEKNLVEGKPFAIRFKVPEGETTWQDAVHGEIRVDHRELDDFIILRSDGSPIYQLAVVVDDHRMGVTHIIRGDDHISNTPKQILLYRALEWEVPRFAHVPLILGPDKKRLSKRHGATSVEEYREMGILPEALFNYLALLGWSPGDDRELMSREEIRESFSLKGISAKSAIFDEQKLRWMNGEYISRKTGQELFDEVIRRWTAAGFISPEDVPVRRLYLLRVIELLKSRVKVLNEYVTYGRYYFQDPDEFDPKGVRKYLKDEQVWDWLREVSARLEKSKRFTADDIERTVRLVAEEYGVAAAKLIHPIRLALTGLTVSPGIFEVMEVLGKETVLRRLNIFITRKPGPVPLVENQQE